MPLRINASISLRLQHYSGIWMPWMFFFIFRVYPKNCGLYVYWKHKHFIIPLYPYTVRLFLCIDALSIAFGKRNFGADSHSHCYSSIGVNPSRRFVVYAFSVSLTHIAISMHIHNMNMCSTWLCKCAVFYAFVWSDMIVWHYYCYSTFIESLSHCEWNIYRSFWR